MVMLERRQQPKQLCLLWASESVAAEWEARCPELFELLCPLRDPLQQWSLWWPHLPCVAVDPRPEWLADSPLLRLSEWLQLVYWPAVACRHRRSRRRDPSSRSFVSRVELDALRSALLGSLEE